MSLHSSFNSQAPIIRAERQLSVRLFPNESVNISDDNGDADDEKCSHLCQLLCDMENAFEVVELSFGYYLLHLLVFGGLIAMIPLFKYHWLDVRLFLVY